MNYKNIYHVEELTLKHHTLYTEYLELVSKLKVNLSKVLKVFFIYSPLSFDETMTNRLTKHENYMYKFDEKNQKLIINLDSKNADSNFIYIVNQDLSILSGRYDFSNNQIIENTEKKNYHLIKQFVS